MFNTGDGSWVGVLILLLRSHFVVHNNKGENTFRSMPSLAMLHCYNINGFHLCNITICLNFAIIQGFMSFTQFNLTSNNKGLLQLHILLTSKESAELSKRPVNDLCWQCTKQSVKTNCSACLHQCLWAHTSLLWNHTINCMSNGATNSRSHSSFNVILLCSK
jgi:hypothetical protein